MNLGLVDQIGHSQGDANLLELAFGFQFIILAAGHLPAAIQLMPGYGSNPVNCMGIIPQILTLD